MKSKCAARNEPGHKKEICPDCLSINVKEYGRELGYLRNVARAAHSVLSGTDTVWRGRLKETLHAWAITPFNGSHSELQKKVLKERGTS